MLGAGVSCRRPSANFGRHTQEDREDGGRCNRQDDADNNARRGLVNLSNTLAGPQRGSHDGRGVLLGLRSKRQQESERARRGKRL